MVYDHHCPWINNCVGAKNYVWFFLFIVTMEINLLFGLIYEIFNLTEKIDWESHSALGVLHIVTVLYTLVTSLFSIPLMYLPAEFRILIYVQSKNCLNNQTTLERFGSKDKSTSDSIKTNSRASSM